MLDQHGTSTHQHRLEQLQRDPQVMRAVSLIQRWARGGLARIRCCAIRKQQDCDALQRRVQKFQDWLLVGHSVACSTCDSNCQHNQKPRLWSQFNLGLNWNLGLFCNNPRVYWIHWPLTLLLDQLQNLYAAACYRCNTHSVHVWRCWTQRILTCISRAATELPESFNHTFREKEHAAATKETAFHQTSLERLGRGASR
jgi:hypothetical protein